MTSSRRQEDEEEDGRRWWNLNLVPPQHKVICERKILERKSCCERKGLELRSLVIKGRNGQRAEGGTE